MQLKYPPLGVPVSPLENVDVQGRYKLPTEVQYCTRCVVSNQRPRIVFDDEGVCNACRWWEMKDSAVDWADRERRLVELCDRFRRDDGSHDVVVPASGGKDSCLVAHMLKYEYGMNPLTVTWSPHIYTEIGWQNLQAMIHSGLDNVLATPNGKVHRLLTRYSFEELGEPFQPFIYGQIWYPVRVAAQNGIQLIFDGENGELEYGGDPKSDVPGFSVSDAVKYWLSDHPLEFWYDRGFSKQDLYYYSPPDQAELEEKKIERHFFSYYKNWRPQDNYYYAQEHCGFEANPLGRSEATYSKYASLDDRIDGFHFYLALMKFGISRATSDAAHEIREGLIEREEAVALVQRYDTEFPGLHFEEFLAYCDITEDHFWDVCDRWRNENLWEKRNTGWELKVQVN